MLLGREDVNPNDPDNFGLTPLHYAAKQGNIQIVNYLLNWNDMNPDTGSRLGHTPLLATGESRHFDVVKLLLQREDVNPDSHRYENQIAFSLAFQCHLIMQD